MSLTAELTIVPPARTIEQRMVALERANEIRMTRAQLKRDIRAGRRHALTVLMAPPDWAETMRVFDLLLAVPKCGPVKASRALNRARVSHSKTLGGLTPRQRRELADELSQRLKTWAPTRRLRQPLERVA